MKSLRHGVAMMLILPILVFMVAGCAKDTDSESQGYAFLDKGDIQSAIEVFQRMTEENPADCEAWMGLAESYWASGDWNKALDVLDSGMESVGSDDTDELRELRKRIEESVAEAVEITPEKCENAEPVSTPETDIDEKEVVEEQQDETEDFPTPVPTTTLTVDYELLESAIFSAHAQLNDCYGGFTSEYTDLGWMIRYGDSSLYCFYGYDATLVDGDGVPFDDSEPNLVMISPLSELLKGGNTAGTDDIEALFGSASFQENVMDGGYNIICEYKGKNISIDCDAAGQIDLQSGSAQIYN